MSGFISGRFLEAQEPRDERQESGGVAETNSGNQTKGSDAYESWKVDTRSSWSVSRLEIILPTVG